MKGNSVFKKFLVNNFLWMFFIIVINAFSGIARTIGASYLQKITDSIETGVIKSLWSLVLVGAMIMTSSYLFRWASAVAARYLTEKLSLETRQQLVEHIKKVPFISFESFKLGDLQSLIRNDVEEASELIYNLFSRILNNIFLFVFSAWYMATINLSATAVIVIVMILMAGINQLILGKVKKYQVASRSSLGKLSAQVENTYTAIETVKTNWAKKYILALFNEERNYYNKQVLKAEEIDAGRLSLYNSINNISLFGAVLFLGIKSLQGEMSIGQVVSFIYLIKQILIPVEVIFRWMGRIVVSNAAWDRIYSVLNLLVSEKKKQINPETVNHIAVNNLSFSYDNKANILDSLSIELKKGEMIGIAGKSGSGKTTLIKILLGLYNSPSAHYKIDNKATESLEEIASFASSEKQVFNLSIYENITLGETTINKEECMKMIEKLGFGDWVSSLTDGIDTLVSSNELSGGQQQMISNARTLLSTSPVIILDEPFSALDKEKEEKLLRELFLQRDNRIVLLTSHREETIKNCDKILSLVGE